MLAFPPDVTFVIQLVSFFVLLLVLNRLLFRPFTDVLAERQRHTDGTRELAAKEQAEAVALARAIEEALEEARAVALADAESIRRDGRDRESEMFNEAKLAAAARLSELRESIGQERVRAAKALRENAAELAKSMADAVLSPPNEGRGR